ncbi:MAG: hypothetical protein QM757_05695 [Paludibaculum sp.]
MRYACSVNGCEDELLGRMLESEDPKLVEAAVESSNRTPLSWAKTALESTDPARRRLGALALRGHSKYALYELPRMLADCDSSVRGAAADALVALGEAVAPVLAPIVADESALSRVRLRALRVRRAPGRRLPWIPCSRCSVWKIWWCAAAWCGLSPRCAIALPS